MADIAGRLNIELSRRPGGLDVRIHSSRPVMAAGVFVGKGLDDAVAGLPTLFSICSTAQACACASACEAAQGASALPALARLRRLLVDAETAKEHLWRLLLDWPRLLGELPDTAAMSAVMRAYRALRAALTGANDPFRLGAGEASPNLVAAAAALDELDRLTDQYVLQAASADWLADMTRKRDFYLWARNAPTIAARLVRDIAGRGWGSLGRSLVGPLPQLPYAELEASLGGAGVDGYVSAPTWRGLPAETTPFSRNLGHSLVAELAADFGNGLVPRLAAGLVELASVLRRLDRRLRLEELPRAEVARETSPGVGLAQVEAARGLLVHRVEAVRGRVRSYCILAPTEWSFHPQGAVAQGLAALAPAGTAALHHQTRLIITAVDPCVDYDVKVS